MELIAALIIYPLVVLVVAITGPHSPHEIADNCKALK